MRDPRAVVEGFFDDLEQALRGAQINPYRSFSEDVELMVTGQTPLSGVWRGMRSVTQDFLMRASPLMGRAAGHGLLPTEFLVQGQRVTILARGRGSNTRGEPYNNTYCLWFDVRDGMIIRYIEDFDSSLAWRVLFGCRLEHSPCR